MDLIASTCRTCKGTYTNNSQESRCNTKVTTVIRSNTVNMYTLDWMGIDHGASRLTHRYFGT